jgi:hypothetical protein
MVARYKARAARRTHHMPQVRATNADLVAVANVVFIVGAAAARGVVAPRIHACVAAARASAIACPGRLRSDRCSDSAAGTRRARVPAENASRADSGQ